MFNQESFPLLSVFFLVFSSSSSYFFFFSVRISASAFGGCENLAKKKFSFLVVVVVFVFSALFYAIWKGDLDGKNPIVPSFIPHSSLTVWLAGVSGNGTSYSIY